MSDLQLVALLLALVGGAVVVTFIRSKRQSAIFEKVEQMSSQLEELTLRVATLELERSGYRLWTSQLRGQVIELGALPVPPPPFLAVTQLVTRATTGNEQDTSEIVVGIYHLVNEFFDIEEINDLALRAGIQPEAFGGDSRPAKARELVEFAFRHHLLAVLVGEARRLRPQVEWPRVTVGGIAPKG